MWAAVACAIDRWRRRRLDRDLSDELSAHLEFAEADYAERGIDSGTARRAARLALGSPEQIRDAVRDANSVWLDNLWRDVRYAARQLRRSPGFTIVAVASLAVGTGATITVFAFASALLLQPLDTPRAEELIRVTGLGGDTTRALATQSEAHIPAQDFFHYRDENQAFTSLAAHFVGGPQRVRLDGPARVIPVTLVSGNYFETLGVRPLLGRTLTPADGRAPAVDAVVLSDAGWRRFFDADPTVVGRTAFIDGRPATIVGVLAASFTGTNAPMLPQIYAPMLESPITTYRVDLIGRLRPGVSAAQATADLIRIARQLSARDGEPRWIESFPGSVLVPLARRAIGLVSSLFIVVVGVVLLIACDNIASLLLTRAMKRRHEIAIRLALGVSRSRLFAQLIIESALLCVAGGLAGIYFAHVTARYLTRFYAPVPMPFALTYELDWRVMAFAVALSCVATMLCGVAPARQALKTDVNTALRSSAVLERSRLLSNLVVTQVTLSTALLILGVVLARSLSAPIAPGGGFTTHGVLMTTIGLNGYAAPQRARLLDAVVAGVERTPGIGSVTIVDSVPLTNNRPITPVEMRANSHVNPVYTNSVAPALFRTLQIALVGGRDFTAGDNPAAPPVGIANETLARRFWPGEAAVGKRIQGPDGAAIEIVGVARDAKYESVEEAPRAFLYRPMGQVDVPAPTFLIKATGTAAGLLPRIRAIIAEVDPDLAPYNLMTLDDRLSLGMMLNRSVAAVSGGLGALALVLSVMGIYGTMSYLGLQRQREIGVRLALGATRSGVIAMMTKQGMVWAGLGLAIGTAAGLAVALVLRSLLYGVDMADPLAFVLTPLALGGAASLACYVPARRAAGLDPLIALRQE